MRTHLIAFLASGLMLSASPAFARDNRPPPETYQKLSACRTITDAAARLKCFDEAAAALDAAVAANDVYMMDRKQVRETRRSLFGLPIPSLGIFGGNGEPEAEDANSVRELVTTIKSASFNGEGWVITVEEGSIWRQTDGVPLALSPKPGMPATIRRAAMGSYKMNVGRQQAIKVKRVI